VAAIRALTRPDLPDPVVAVMSRLGYHGLVPGRRDLSFGLETLTRADDQAPFPVLCANLVHRTTQKPAFAAYAVHELGGLRIGVIGLTSEAPESPELLLRDPVETARSLERTLRKDESVHLVFALLREAQPRTLGSRLAKEVPGLDLLVGGESIGDRHLGGPTGSGSVGLAELTLAREKDRIKVHSVKVQSIPVAEETPLDAQVTAVTQPQRRVTDTYLDTFVTHLGQDLDGRWARMEDTPIAQLMHRAARQATGADLTALPVPPPRYYVPTGPATVRQLWALAPDEDRLVVISVEGRQLKAYLEHAFRIYRPSHEPELFQRGLGPGDMDLVHGVSFAVDLGKPVGSRILNLRFRGKPVTPEQTFTLALLSRRLDDDGGYLTAVGWTGSPLRRTDTSYRNVLLGFALAQPTLTLEVSQPWRTIPWLDRERVAAQQ